MSPALSRVLAGLCAGASMALLAGCGSPVPQASSYPLSFQRHMQAVEHWQILAEDTADQLAEKLPADSPPLHVRAVGEPTTFSRAFDRLLEQALFERGYTVSLDAPGAVNIEYETQTIRFSGDRQSISPTMPLLLGAGIGVARIVAPETIPLWAALGGGAAGAYGSRFLAETTDTDLLVIVSVYDEKTLWFRTASIYYIDDKDARHYAGNLLPAAVANSDMLSKDTFDAADARCAARNQIALPRSAPRSDATPIRFECVDRW